MPHSKSPTSIDMAMIISPSTSRIQVARKTFTFTGASGFGLAAADCVLFTVTGDVYIHAIIPKCTTLLTESGATATLSLGTATQVARFVAATNAVEIDADELWFSTTPTAGSLDLPDAMQSVVIASGDDIVARPAVTNVTGGVIEFTCLWEAVSTDGTLVAA